MKIRNLFIGAGGASIGIVVYTRAGMIPGILSTLMASWLLFQFRSLENSWDSLGNFQNPVLFGLNSAFAAYIYLQLRGISGRNIYYLFTAIFLIGFALSTLLTKYWNIGP